MSNEWVRASPKRKHRRGSSLSYRRARFAGLLSPAEWREVVRELGLSPGQARIVRLILRGCPDKQIGAALGLKRSTVRTYLHRIFARLEATDRVEIVLCVFAAFRRIQGRERCPPKV